MGRDTIQLEDTVSTISKAYLLDFTSEYGIPESLHPELPGLEEPIVEFPEGKVGVYTKFFKICQLSRENIPYRRGMAHKRPKDKMSSTDSYSAADVIALNTHRTPIQKQLEALLCLVGLSRSYFLGDDVYPPFLYDDDRDMDLVNLISAPNPTKSTLKGKSLAPMRLDSGSIFSTPATQDVPTTAKSVSDPYSLSYTKPSSKKTATVIPTRNVATTEVQGIFSTESLELGKSTSFPSVDGSPGGGYGFSTEAKIRTKGKITKESHSQDSQTGLEDPSEGGRDEKETLLETKVDTKKAAEAKNAKLAKKLESLRVQFSDLQVSNNQLSQQVSNLQAQVTGEEKIKSAFEEFKKYEDDKVEQRCAEMDARLDKLSVDFNKELYPHMLTAIAGRRWVIGHGLRLTVMKSETRYRAWEGRPRLATVEAYNPEADSKYVKALQDLNDLKYPLVDQLERLKDAPMS
nr:hypothetical protein [Tanacetum cinerariifolium]